MNDGRIAIAAMDLLLRNDAVVSVHGVKQWLTTRDPDVLSVIYEAVSRAHERIEGGLPPEVYFELVTLLMSVLLREQGESDYALSGYDAARIYADFLVQCASDTRLTSGGDKLLRAGVEHLAALYRSGNEAQQRCVVDGVLEHVFHHHVARAAFSEWKRDPVLNGAHTEALEGSQE